MLTLINSQIMLKLGLAALLGLTIGLEREIKRKQLGFKTCLVISISSCLLTIISIESSYIFSNSSNGININMDPLRLAAQIVSGVGFIGAGVILKKGHDSVSGLTTAALIWSASGIGIAVGAGFYFAAILAVILLILSVEVLPLLFALFGLKPLGEKEIILQLMLAHSDQYSIVIDKIKQQRIAINYIHIKDLDGTHQLHLKVSVDHKRNMLEIFQHVSEIEGIQGVEIESI